jgi:hypothetical protein
MSFHPFQEESVPLVLPEGEGDYYYKKDVEESLHENRESCILPVAEARECYSWVRNIAEGMRDEKERDI